MVSKALDGLRVLVPRGGNWGDSIAALLRDYSAVPVIAPLINFAPSENIPALANAFHELDDGQFDWLVVTSATTVDVLVASGVRIPENTRIAAVGETTAIALTLAGLQVDFVPEFDNSGRGLVKEWPTETAGLRVLAPQSNLADTTLVDGLGAMGHEVVSVSAYTTVGVPVVDTVREDVASGRISAVLVSSGSVARQIAAQLAPLPESTLVACIGPRTAFDARAAGLTVHMIAEGRTSEALVEVLADYTDQ
ncbi:uroporphyrinogen-III synthase [Rhodoglobus vestalii]|uniref:Uroporphyrinogen-III synthase n=1 Tax=Rhodoglobus vestalii TaxID=193384 RepID=A0A8H2K6Y2_9MICO|nr:uroporphyrinogen-III synthase [Rhodoglobus vestalii]TQO19953.1 uroporphyrinogen-III synthase [Rhodoglobus vestalii]